MRYLLGSFIVLILFQNCGDKTVGIPKPRTYPRLILPPKAYISFNEPYCPFQFNMAEYSQIVQDQLYFDQKPINPCWFDIEFPKVNGKIHCSYYPIASRTQLDQLISDAFELIDKHRIKANYIEEEYIQNDYGVSGVYFKLSGPVASPSQFFLTDSTHHFLRAALYFKNEPNPDSMEVVHKYIQEDMRVMIESFSWK